MTDLTPIGAMLDEVKRIVTTDRQETHGDTEDSFDMIAQLWTVYLRHRFDNDECVKLEVHDVAQMMSLLKKARATYSVKYNPDNYLDDIGYTAIASLFKGE